MRKYHSFYFEKIYKYMYKKIFKIKKVNTGVLIKPTDEAFYLTGASG